MDYTAVVAAELCVALDNELIISETFYSIQGEGTNMGVPAVFLRLAGCNLRCNGFSYKHPITGEHLGCDTKHVWQQGDRHSFNDIITYWQQQGWLQKLTQGALLVITGGEPVIQQIALINFISQLDQTVADLFIEMETNASLDINAALLHRLNQINASPKLVNSGESRNKAVNHELLEKLTKLNKAKFKFVIAKPEDVDEVINNYLQPFNINYKNVWLMPEGGTVSEIQSKSLWLVELCKQYNLNYCPRLHIHIWNEATGV